MSPPADHSSPNYRPETGELSFEGRVDVGSAELFVRQLDRAEPDDNDGGDGGTADRPDLLFVHGGPDWNHRIFLPFVEPLVEHARLTFFDIRGCGRSERFDSPDAYHHDRVVEDLHGLLEEFELGPTILLGLSFGGRIALRFVCEHPDAVDGLVLASTTAYEDDEHALEEWPAYRERRTDAMREAEVAILNSEELSPEQKSERLSGVTLPVNVWDRENLSLARLTLDRMGFSGEWMKAWRAGELEEVEHPDYESCLRDSGLPTLVLHGAKDMRFHVSAARRLVERVETARLVELPQTGHLAHLEAPQAWNRAVATFTRS